MYYVYTRRVLKNGVVIKYRRTFNTRKAQVKYITNAPMSIIVTSYN